MDLINCAALFSMITESLRLCSDCRLIWANMRPVSDLYMTVWMTKIWSFQIRTWPLGYVFQNRSDFFAMWLQSEKPGCIDSTYGSPVRYKCHSFCMKAGRYEKETTLVMKSLCMKQLTPHTLPLDHMESPHFSAHTSPLQLHKWPESQKGTYFFFQWSSCKCLTPLAFTATPTRQICCAVFQS